MATIRAKGVGWEAMVRRKGHLPISRSFDKKVLAERWAREKESEIDAGVYKDSREAQKTPLNALFTRYEYEIIPRRSGTSHVPDNSRLKTLKQYFLGYMVGFTTSDHVVQFVKERLKAVGSDAVRKELHILSDVFDCARALWNIHVTNPVPDAKRVIRKLRLFESPGRRKRRLRPGEYEKIENAPHKLFTLINKAALFAIETALRRSELCNSRREYVDFPRCTLHVPKSKTDWKTGKKGREVPLSPIALKIIQSIPIRIDGLLFGLKPDSVTQGFKRLCKQQGIVDLRWHDLRHEAISRWFEMGFQKYEIQAMSGNYESLDIYTHPDMEELAKRFG